MLIRRLRDQCAGDDLQVVGTSATMASGGTLAERNAVVAAGRHPAVRHRGHPRPGHRRDPGPRHRRPTPEPDGARRGRRAQRRPGGCRSTTPSSPPTRWPAGWRPRSAWTSRRAPAGWSGGPRPPCPQAAARARRAHRPATPTRCAAALRNVLQEGSQVAQPGTGRPVFAFRLHQFLSKGDTVYVSLEPEDHPAHHRHLPGQRARPARQGAAAARVLPRVRPGVPGRRQDRHGTVRRVFVSRRDADASGGDSVTGYLYVSSDLPWPDDPLAAGRLPESWLVTDPDTDRVEILDSKRKYLPDKVFLLPGRHRRRRPAAACRRGSSPPRSRSACAAASPTSRSAATTSASSPPSTPRAAPAP